MILDPSANYFRVVTHAPQAVDLTDPLHPVYTPIPLAEPDAVRIDTTLPWHVVTPAVMAGDVVVTPAVMALPHGLDFFAINPAERAHSYFGAPSTALIFPSWEWVEAAIPAQFWAEDPAA